LHSAICCCCCWPRRLCKWRFIKKPTAMQWLMQSVPVATLPYSHAGWHYLDAHCQHCAGWCQIHPAR
jgi:hypothetical protein